MVGLDKGHLSMETVVEISPDRTGPITSHVTTCYICQF